MNTTEQTTAITPGPWKYSCESVDPEWAIVTTTAGAIVANVNAGGRQEANARAIAALPELIEALRTLVRRIERDNLHTTQGVQIEAARAALAKALHQATGGAS